MFLVHLSEVRTALVAPIIIITIIIVIIYITPLTTHAWAASQHFTITLKLKTTL